MTCTGRVQRVGLGFLRAACQPAGYEPTAFRTCRGYQLVVPTEEGLIEVKVNDC